MKLLMGLFGCAILVIAVAAWQNRDATVYAPGFTEAKFRTIRVGMPKAAVVRILGEPVSIDRASGYIYWIYPDTCLGGARSNPDVPVNVQANVTFRADLGDKIEDVYGDPAAPGPGQHAMIGHSLEEVRRRFGEPREKFAVPDREYYWYSKIQNFKGQYIRGIAIYDTGVVGSIEAGRIGHYIEGDGVQPSPSSWGEWLEWNL